MQRPHYILSSSIFPSLSFLAFLHISFFLTLISPSPAAAEDNEVKQSMAEIYKSMQVLLPESLNIRTLNDLEKKKQFEENLKILREKSKWLAEHTGDKEVGFQFLSYSLAADVEEAHFQYSRGRISDSQAMIRSLVSNCVSCHSRLPGQDLKGQTALFSQIKFRNLSLIERARLEVALRQFDKALMTYEEIIASQRFPWPRNINADPFIDYLTISIRVKSDYARALTAISNLKKKRTVPPYLRADLEVWIDSLNQLKNDKKLHQKTIDTVRVVMNKAKQKMEFQLDNKGLIYHIHASKLIHEILDNDKLPAHQKAEAYYLLGLTEMLMGRGYWLPKAVQYLESSIRLAPKTRYARKAYETLEGHVIIYAYSIDSEAVIPQQLANKLKELRTMVEGNM